MLFDPVDRAYTDWEPKLDYDPIKQKLLVGDQISDDNIKLVSKYRTMNNIPGILIFNGKTFGQYGSRFLYRCIPNNRKLPEFLVPYKEKISSFSKNKINKYVLFRFVEWFDKHPMGILTNVLGDVTEHDILDDYQLYCKDIYVSNQKFQKATTKALKNYNDDDLIIDIQPVRMITIDPKGSIDLDDALGVSKHKNGYIVHIAITNVAHWLDTLELWDDMSDRVATIYLANRNISMLPTVLGENICSLHCNQPKHVVTMNVLVENEIIEHVYFKREIISVVENYSYEDDELLNDESYLLLKSISEKINENSKYLEKISDSHDVVAFYMIMMNHIVGKHLIAHKVGIYRSVVCNEKDTSIPIEGYRKYAHIYGEYANSENQLGHQMFGVDTYTQCTSPLRRIIDLVNIIELQKICCNWNVSTAVERFTERWMNNIDDLNRRMKAIRKIQNDSTLLDLCINKQFTEVSGYIIDTNYTVFIPDINLTTIIISSEPLKLYNKYDFTLYVFMDEHTLKQKIKLQIKL